MKKVILLSFVALLLSACADQVNFVEAATHAQVGFWYGLWHGFILPFSWLISLFDSNVAVYAVYNNGGWYDFGFVLGVVSMFGGSHGHRRVRRINTWRVYGKS